jgi:citrate synthase
MTAGESYSPGLEGVLAGETAVSTLAGGLIYRGYPAVELAEKASYDEVAYLLLHGELPMRDELHAFQQRVADARQLPTTLRDLLRGLPAATSPMDALRSSVSVLAHYDPEVRVNSHAANVRKAERLLGQIPLALAEHYRNSKGLPPVAPRRDLAHAGNFLHVLRDSEPQPEHVRALDVSLTLYAEHEFNASTFAARVVCSTESDLHSAIVAGIGALKGRLHGGANERVMDVLRAAGGPETAERWIRDALARKEKVMGFGHRVYKTGDERAVLLKMHARQAAQAAGLMKWEETADVIERVMAAEKKLLPNVDWPAGRLYNALGLDVSLYTPIFVLARVAGWSAHIIEQLDHNRLIRPGSLYTGPATRPVRPHKERG